MKNLEFPVINVKVPNLDRKFNLNDPAERKEYFDAKVGKEIAQIKEFMKNNTFVANMLGKKYAGKGTYSKIFGEIFGKDNIAHVSVGDLVRETHANWSEFEKSEQFEEMKKHYRGYISFDEAIERLHGRSQSSLLPTEFILALLKHYIKQHKGKTLFIDGLPREMDQVSYSLFFRDLINYADQPDIFVMIDIPEAVIDERIKSRVVCPSCKTPRNTKLLVTSKVGYDKDNKEFYLMCDNPDCNTSARMLSKEGDELGIEPIRARLAKDEEIMKMIYEVHGVPKVLLRNNIPVSVAHENYDDYEITPGYSYELNADGSVKVNESEWTFKDDNGIESVSLLPYAVVVTMLKQLPAALGL